MLEISKLIRSETPCGDYVVTYANATRLSYSSIPVTAGPYRPDLSYNHYAPRNSHGKARGLAKVSVVF